MLYRFTTRKKREIQKKTLNRLAHAGNSLEQCVFTDGETLDIKSNILP